MIPRLKADLGWHELAAAFRPSAPDDVQRFEQAFATLMGQREAVAFPYGRTGLALLLEAMGLQGSEIICPAYSCVVVAHAIVKSGNTPVFVDSRPDDFNMDLALVRDAITECTGAVLATSIFGYPVDLDALDALKRDFPHLKVIQDCAHSFAADWQGRPVQRAGEAAIFGLNISKVMTSIFGGMVTTDDYGLAARLRRLRDERTVSAAWHKGLRRLVYFLVVQVAFWEPMYTLVNAFERLRLLDRFVKYYDEGVIDMPADYLERMSSLEARVGSAQVDRYPQIVENRRELARYYHDALQGLPDVILPPLVTGATYSHFVIRVPRRERVLAAGLAAGVQLGRLIEYTIPHLAAYRDHRFLDAGVSSRMADESINLPIHTGAVRRRERVVAVFKAALARARADA